MAEIKWIKITVNMFDDEKIKYIRTLPSGNDMVLFWVMLLTKAGKCNSNGYIFLTENIPYTSEMLANEFDFELNTVKLALEVLQKLNMIEIEEAILIQNWGKHQNIEGMDKIREQNRIRQNRYRAKVKLLEKENSNVKSNVTVTECNGTDIDIDIDKEVINKNARVREDYVKILDYFCNKADMFQPSANDILTAKKLIADNIPFEIIVYGIDESFKKYKPKYEGDKIRALSYCEGSIRKKHKIEQAKAVDIVGENRPDTGTSTKYPDFDESKYLYKGDGE